MFHRKPKEILDDWTKLQEDMHLLEVEYNLNKERMQYREQLLDAELLLARDFYQEF